MQGPLSFCRSLTIIGKHWLGPVDLAVVSTPAPAQD
jgi:hypothetical protein